MEKFRKTEHNCAKHIHIQHLQLSQSNLATKYATLSCFVSQESRRDTILDS